MLPTVQNTYFPSPAFTSAILNNISTNQSASLPLYQQLLDVWTHPTSPGAQNATPIDNSCGNVTPSNLPGITADTPCVMGFSATPTQLSTEWILSGRVDQNIGDNDRLFGRYRMDRGLQATYTDPISSAFNATSNQPSYDGQVQWTHVISSNATNQFIGSGSWYSAKFLQNESVADAAFPYGVFWQSGTFASMNNGLGYFGRRWSFPQGRNITQYQLADDFVLVKGNHTIKMGLSFRRYDVSDFNFMYKYPRLYFNSMLGFAQGYATRYRQWFSDTSAVPIALYGLGWYGQDEWRVNNRLKLTLGLRMEHNSNPVCQTDCFAQFVAPWQSLNHGPDVPYNQNIQTGIHQAFRGTDAVNFSPRIGFTYSPFANDKTVISGGFGLFYDAFAQGIMEPAFQSAPGVVDQSVYGQLWADPTAAGAPAIAASSAAALKAGFSQGATFNSLSEALPNFRAPTFTNFAGKFHTPRYQEWNLQVQQMFSNNMAIAVNYFGTHGIFIPYNNGTLNAYDPGYCGDVDGNSVSCGAGFPAAPPDPSYAIVNQWSTGAASNTNGLTTTFNRRLAQGLSAQASYTWSHGLDDVSNGGAFVYGNDSLGGQLNPAGLRLNNYGNSDYDIRNNFSANFVWEPQWKYSNKAVTGALGGWSFSGTIFARTGLPYTIMDANSYFPNFAGAGYIPGQPLGTGATFASGSCSNGNSQCFDPNGFVDAVMLPVGSTVAYAQYPTQRRNQYRGPNFFDFNFSTLKNFNLTERFKLGVGANFYNLFNHPNFYLPNLYLSSGDPTVGRIQQTVATPASPYGSFVGAAASPRLIQLTAKITF